MIVASKTIDQVLASVLVDKDAVQTTVFQALKLAYGRAM
jgi:hypothetical protein